MFKKALDFLKSKKGIILSMLGAGLTAGGVMTYTQWEIIRTAFGL